jgi:hypothetical protein
VVVVRYILSSQKIKFQYKEKNKMAVWKDVSHYSENTSEKAPNKFRLDLKPVAITVSRHPTGNWIMTTNTITPMVILQSKDIEDAKEEAIVIIQKWLQNMLKEIPLNFSSKKK